MKVFSGSIWYIVSGTSVACPMWAGLISIVDQGRALRGLSSLDGPTQTLPMLYSLPQSDFHDILSGNNGYAAGPGYDLVTGRGSPNVPSLVADMVGAEPGFSAVADFSAAQSPAGGLVGDSLGMDHRRRSWAATCAPPITAARLPDQARTWDCSNTSAPTSPT